MIFRSAPAAAMPRPQGFDSLQTGRLTYLGLTVAGIGWALLLGETTVADVLTKGARAVPPTFHADLLDIAKCIIASGFALAVVGALQAGFGTLNRFFEAVLSRSAQRTAESESVEPVASAPAPSSKRPRYRMLPDGSVEVETIVGTRRFDSLAEARDFI